MYYENDPFQDRLTNAKSALTNALADEYIRTGLARLGVDENKLNEGMALYQRAEQLYQLQKKEYSEQFEAGRIMYKAWDDAMKDMKLFTTVAHLVLNDVPKMKEQLGLDGIRKTSIPDWIAWAKLFFTNALASPEILQKFGTHLITVEMLQAGSLKVTAFEAAHAKQRFEMGEAQQATRDRDAAFEELDKFMYMLKKIAKSVLTEKPEYLEKLGILKRSAPIRKKKVVKTTVAAEEKPANQEITGE